MKILASEIPHYWIPPSVAQIEITGARHGNRVVIRNAKNVKLLFDAEFNSTHPEDGICFEGLVENVEIGGNLRLNQALTFWGRLENVRIEGIESSGAHTGIRATTDTPSRNVRIQGNRIVGTSHEGIYWGPSMQTSTPAHNVTIQDNFVSDCGWDGIQVGNTRNAYINNNIVTHCGRARQYGQDYGITINPGCLAWVWGNEIMACAKPIQILDSRVFAHPPKR